jgi:glutaredoxin
MTITLYGSQISTFSRKIAVALALKKLPFEFVDALTKDMHGTLREANPRIEVPVLFDDGIAIINSSDIIQYVDQKYPERPLLPAPIADRVIARAFERLADHRLDPIVVDCSSGIGRTAVMLLRMACSKPRPILTSYSIGLRRCFVTGRSRGHSVDPEWWNARGFRTLPPCHSSVCRLTLAGFPTPLHGSKRSAAIQRLSPMRKRPRLS